MPVAAPSAPPRVLLVGKAAPDQGGVRTFLDMLMASDLARDHRARLLNLAHSEERQGGRATLANVRRTLHDAVRLRRAARGADVVHLHSALAPTVTAVRAGLLGAAGRSRRCRVIVHAHGGLVQVWMTTWWRRLVLRLALLPAHRVVAVSEGGRVALAGVVGAPRLTRIDNAVDVDVPLRSSGTHAPPRILYVGLLTPRKGVLDLVDAAQLLRERGVAHELHLVGGTPDEGREAERQVRDALTDGAVLRGTLPHERMPEVYSGVDVFCLPSWWEAMPLSILEAMASGLPVVATDVGDVRRLVEDGRTGLVVPARSPGALADALETLLRDPDLRAAMGDAGRRRAVDDFSLHRLESDLRRLYADPAGSAS